MPHAPRRQRQATPARNRRNRRPRRPCQNKRKFCQHERLLTFAARYLVYSTIFSTTSWARTPHRDLRAVSGRENRAGGEETRRKSRAVPSCVDSRVAAACRCGVKKRRNGRSQSETGAPKGKRCARMATAAVNLRGSGCQRIGIWRYFTCCTRENRQDFTDDRYYISCHTGAFEQHITRRPSRYFEAAG